MISFDEIDEIVEIEETADVYDIAVEDTHNFFANGILVHNCLGGPLNYDIFQQLREISFDKMHSSLLDDEALLRRCVTAVSNTYDQYIDAVGKGNLKLELQFNKLPAQDLCNRVLLEFAKRNSLTDQLIVTADSHYARPELWKHREMYKKLGYINYSELGPESLPKSIDELKCELYPKNAEQIWKEYLGAKERSPFYSAEDDELVCDAVERTYDIAHDVIGEVKYDTSYKYPKTAPEGTTDHQELLRLCREGIVKKGLDKKPEYVERMLHELKVIKKLKNSAYLVLMAKVMELAKKRCLTGISRGCFTGDARVQLTDGKYKQISDIKIGESVIDAFSSPQVVLDCFSYEIDEEIIVLEFENDVIIRCTKDHEFLTQRGWVQAQFLTAEDDIAEPHAILNSDEQKNFINT